MRKEGAVAVTVAAERAEANFGTTLGPEPEEQLKGSEGEVAVAREDQDVNDSDGLHAAQVDHPAGKEEAESPGYWGLEMEEYTKPAVRQGEVVAGAEAEVDDDEGRT